MPIVLLIFIVLVSTNVIFAQEEDDNDEGLPNLNPFINLRFGYSPVLPKLPFPDDDLVEDDDDTRRKRQVDENVQASENQNRTLTKQDLESDTLKHSTGGNVDTNKDVSHIPTIELASDSNETVVNNNNDLNHSEDQRSTSSNDSESPHMKNNHVKAHNSSIPKLKSKCCNAEIVNIFHYMDLESRHMCFKKYQIKDISAEKQVKYRACIAECVAKHKRYITTKGKVFVSELTNNLKIAFNEMQWVIDIIDEIINTCVENYEIYSDTEMHCRTKTMNIGICIGRKLQFECYENHLVDESACLQEFFDVKYYKCVAASPGFGCHTIR